MDIPPPSESFLDSLATNKNLRPDTWYLIAVRSVQVLENMAHTTLTVFFVVWERIRRGLRLPLDTVLLGSLRSINTP
jgi:hypothetical protein